MLRPEQLHTLSIRWFEDLTVEQIALELDIKPSKINHAVKQLRKQAKTAGRLEEFEFWSRPRGKHPRMLLRDLSKMWFDGRSVRYITRKFKTTVVTINSWTYRLRQMALAEGRPEEAEFWSRDYKVHSDLVLRPIQVRKPSGMPD